MRASPIEPTHGRVEARLREYFRVANLRQPDRTWHEPGSNQLVLAWHSENVALVVELATNGPVDIDLRPLRGAEAARWKAGSHARDEGS